MRDRIPSCSCHSVFKDRATSPDAGRFAPSPALDCRVSRRQPACVKGAVDLQPPPGFVKAAAVKGPLPRRRKPTLTSASRPRSRVRPEATSGSTPEEELPTPLLRGPVRRDKPGKPLLPPLSPRGSRLVPSMRRAVKQGLAGRQRRRAIRQASVSTREFPDHPSHGRRSSRPRRSASADADADGSRRPSSRARSCATTAATWARAWSRSSFTTR